MNDGVLELAPIAVLTVNTSGKVTYANSLARTWLNAEPGRGLLTQCRGQLREAFSALLAAGEGTREAQLETEGKTRAVSITVHRDERAGGHAVFMTDISEKTALSRQLRGTQEPGKRLIHQLSNAHGAMLGYAELIEVMLDEDATLDGERLNVVRRYHKELRRAQQTVDRLLKQARHGGKRPETGAVPLNRRQVVIINDDPTAAEYLTELIRSLQHRVTTFTEPAKAKAYLKEQGEHIDLVVIDIDRSGTSGTDLARRLHKTHDRLPVLVCSAAEFTPGDDEPLYRCEKPLDINDLIQIVTELV